MKVLIAHARYQQPGGEETVVEMQTSVLRALGHEVVRFEPDNAILPTGLIANAAMVWSRKSRREIADVIARERPDLLHVHNNFHQLSPSIYAAANDAGVPVVQHVHNARMVCVNAFLERDGRSCEDCVGSRLSLPGVAHRCYRDSLVQSVAATAIQVTHRTLRTWSRRVDLFLPVGGALAATLTSSGVVPAAKVRVCHNAVDPDPGARVPADDQGYATFCGRISTEKGLDVLLDASAEVPEFPLRIVGDGPDLARLRARAADLTHVTFTGRVPHAEALAVMRHARVTVAPSTGQEPFGNVVAEAAALGVPTIGSDIGAIPEIIERDKTGVLVPAGDVDELANALRMAHTDPARMAAFGRAARQRFETHFSAAAFGERLLAAYKSVL